MGFPLRIEAREGGNGGRDETDDAPVAGERRRKRSAERIAKANWHWHWQWHWQWNDERHLLGLSLHLLLCQVLINNECILQSRSIMTPRALLLPAYFLLDPSRRPSFRLLLWFLYAYLVYVPVSPSLRPPVPNSVRQSLKHLAP